MTLLESIYVCFGIWNNWPLTISYHFLLHSLPPTLMAADQDPLLEDFTVFQEAIAIHFYDFRASFRECP